MAGMNYELAKELKEQSFPVERGAGIWITPGNKKVWVEQVSSSPREKIAAVVANKDWLYEPTLSELIEACGGFCFELIKLPNEQWCAKESGNRGSGSTPEEAVARLWLALRKGNG